MSTESIHDMQTPSGFRAVLDEFRVINPLLSLGAVSVFLALGEAGRELDVNELAVASGMPVVQVCRFADILTKSDSRPGKVTVKLLDRETVALGRTPRFRMTPAGHDAYDRLFPGTAPALQAAA